MKLSHFIECVETRLLYYQIIYCKTRRYYSNTKEMKKNMALSKEEYIEYIQYIEKCRKKESSSNVRVAYCAYAVGTFADFRNKVLLDYPEFYNDEVTFGILLADPRQSECKEYLLNYLNYFHKKSQGIFNFYIPGFTDNPYYYGELEEEISVSNISKNIPMISIEKKDYYFCREYYENFIDNLEQIFNIQPTFNPMLILMEMKPGHIKGAKFVVIELDSLDSHGIRRSSQFFNELLNITKKAGTLEEIVNRKELYYAHAKCIDTIISAIGVNWLTEVKTVYDEHKRYKIKTT